MSYPRKQQQTHTHTNSSSKKERMTARNPPPLPIKDHSKQAEWNADNHTHFFNSFSLPEGYSGTLYVIIVHRLELTLNSANGCRFGMGLALLGLGPTCCWLANMPATPGMSRSASKRAIWTLAGQRIVQHYSTHQMKHSNHIHAYSSIASVSPFVCPETLSLSCMIWVIRYSFFSFFRTLLVTLKYIKFWRRRKRPSHHCKPLYEKRITVAIK